MQQSMLAACPLDILLCVYVYVCVHVCMSVGGSLHTVFGGSLHTLPLHYM
jgi:hypothetical protein